MEQREVGEGGGKQLEDVLRHVLELRLAPMCRACATGCAQDSGLGQRAGWVRWPWVLSLYWILRSVLSCLSCWQRSVPCLPHAVPGYRSEQGRPCPRGAQSSLNVELWLEPKKLSPLPRIQSGHCFWTGGG